MSIERDNFGGKEKDPLEKELSAVTAKTIKDFGERIKKELNRTWKHASEDEPGKQKASQPIEFNEEIFNAFDPS